MKWIDYKTEKPLDKGKYVVKTITPHKNIHRFDALFNGKDFEINNQIVTHWLKEDDKISEN